jgi:hypothetical protein
MRYKSTHRSLRSSCFEPSQKSSIVECNTSANVKQSSRSPYEATGHQCEAIIRHPVLDLLHRSLWKPLYITALIALVAAFVLISVSFAVDMPTVELKPTSYMRTSVFAAVCDGGWHRCRHDACRLVARAWHELRSAHHHVGGRFANEALWSDVVRGMRHGRLRTSPLDAPSPRHAEQSRCTAVRLL